MSNPPENDSPINLQIFEFFFDSQAIKVRADGYWNATQMCKVGNKLFADFARLKSTKAYLAELSSDMGIPISRLVYSSKGKFSDGREQGTWVYDEIALKLAAWINPKFEVWVFRIIKKLLTESVVRLEEERNSLQESLRQSQESEAELLQLVSDHIEYIAELEEQHQWQLASQEHYYSDLQYQIENIETWKQQD